MSRIKIPRARRPRFHDAAQSIRIWASSDLPEEFRGGLVRCVAAGMALVKLDRHGDLEVVPRPILRRNECEFFPEVPTLLRVIEWLAKSWKKVWGRKPRFWIPPEGTERKDQWDKYARVNLPILARCLDQDLIWERPPVLADRDTEELWPPHGHVGCKELQESPRWRKQGKNPPRGTIQRWENKTKPRTVYRDSTHEAAFPEAWAISHLKQWTPRPSPRRRR